MRMGFYLDGIFLSAELLVMFEVERRAVQLTRNGSDGFTKLIDPGYEIRSTHRITTRVVFGCS